MIDGCDPEQLRQQVEQGTPGHDFRVGRRYPVDDPAALVERKRRWRLAYRQRNAEADRSLRWFTRAIMVLLVVFGLVMALAIVGGVIGLVSQFLQTGQD